MIGYDFEQNLRFCLETKKIFARQLGPDPIKHLQMKIMQAFMVHHCH